jgi:lipopolysaccharide assembly outer membrane protein LptD (OstA)
MLRVYIFLLFLLGCHAANAAGRREIQIVQADAARSYRMGDATINRLVGNVVLLHNNTLMNCDSAYLYPDQRFEAFGNVVIHKDTTWLYGNYLDYRSAVSTGIL